MKFFIDTAEIEDIRRISQYGILSGVTTNPSLIAQQDSIRSREDIFKHYHQICSIVDGDVSAEVTATDYEGMLGEGRDLSAIHPNIVVKVPMTPDGVRALHTLHSENIRTNCTLIFSVSQALLAAAAGATYISPFVGRLDDIGEDGVDLVAQICTAMIDYSDTQVLAASIRNTAHVEQCDRAGADVATCPPKVFDEMFQHDLTDAGLKKFLDDYQKIKQKF